MISYEGPKKNVTGIWPSESKDFLVKALKKWLLLFLCKIMSVL